MVILASASSHAPALGGLNGRFMELHVAGGQGPEAAPRLDGAAAEQDALLPPHDRADHDLRILVIDEAAIGTDLALPVVAIRDEGPRWAPRRRRARHPGKCGEVASAPQGAR